MLLPDRTVFACGGNLTGKMPGMDPDPIRDAEWLRNAVRQSEIYDPSTGNWTEAATATVPRLYHSVALLLPDGRVITAGSTPDFEDAELRLELFHPPYLFRGPRPFIESAPRKVHYGGQIEILTPKAQDIMWVHLIRPMATTHSYDSEQRLVDLEFKRRGACHLDATIPNEPNLAPPGWYMLSITNRKRVPSVAKWVHLSRR